MGLVSSIIKGGKSAISYGKRIAKVAPDALLGDTSEVIGNAMRHQKGSILTKGKAGFHALEKHVARQSKNGGFFTRVWKNLKSTPSSVAKGYKTAAATAKAAGKSGLWAGLKGGGKALAKKMPLIGAVLTIAIEAPNIVSAFKDGGFKSGMKELGGAGVELGCMAAGAAIGSAICPGAGTLIGGVIGGIAGMFVRGKTHSEKKAEEEALAQATNQYSKEDIQALMAYGFTQEEIQALQDSGYTIEQVEQAILAEMNQMQTETSKQQSNSRVQQQYYPQEQVAQQEVVQQPQTYDPTLAYNYNYQIPQTGINPFLYNNTTSNPFLNTTQGGKYTNDIFYQQLFGNYTNPYFNTGFTNQQYLC